MNRRKQTFFRCICSLYITYPVSCSPYLDVYKLSTSLEKKKLESRNSTTTKITILITTLGHNVTNISSFSLPHSVNERSSQGKVKKKNKNSKVRQKENKKKFLISKHRHIYHKVFHTLNT